jgi:hypothetical protein
MLKAFAPGVPCKINFQHIKELFAGGYGLDDLVETDEVEEAPLHLAASHQHTDIVRWLLEAGASVDIEAGDGQTPLHRAVSHLDDPAAAVACSARRQQASTIPALIGRVWSDRYVLSSRAGYQVSCLTDGLPSEMLSSQEIQSP